MATLDDLKRRLTFINRDLSEAVATNALYQFAASSDALIGRLGTSRATNAFNLVRTHLVRSIVLALTRIWDKTGTGTSPVERLMRDIARPENVAEIKAQRHQDRVARRTRLYRQDENEETMAALEMHLARDNERQGEEAAASVDPEIRSCQGLITGVTTGPLEPINAALKRLRNKRIAHTEVDVPKDRPEPAHAVQFGDERIFLKATIAIVEKLNSLVNDRNIDMGSHSAIWDQYAAYFWTPIRAETGDEVRALRSHKSDPEV